MHGRAAILFRLAGVLAALPTAFAAAQPAGSPPPPAANPGRSTGAAAALPAPLAPVDVAAVSARGLVRIALLDLKLSQRPGEPEFLTTAALLSLAHELLPADADVLRLLIEAVNQRGDAERASALNAKLVVLDPTDRVAQLGRITYLIGQMQSVDERLAAYSRFLGPAGEQLDPGLRSRLAMDSALLLRERGDADGFNARLRAALALDPTNKDAATLLFTVVSKRVAQGEAPASDRLDALLVLLAADPIDPLTHLSIARELSTAGASAAAERFYDNYGELCKKFESRPAPSVGAERLIEMWRVSGPAKVVGELSGAVLIPRREAYDLLRRFESGVAKLPAGQQLPKPEDVRLPGDLERVWLLAADAAENQVFTTFAYLDLVHSYERLRDFLNAPTEALSPEQERVLRDDLSGRDADLAWLRLLIGIDVGLVPEQIARMKLDPALKGVGVARLEAFLDVREGDVASGETRLEPLAREGDELAALALAVSESLHGKDEEAGRRFAAASVRLSGSAYGAWAASRAKRLTGSPAPAVPDAARAQAAADSIPAFFDALARDPRRFSSIRASVTPSTAGPFEPFKLTIAVRNTSPRAFAIGSERSINSRILISPSVSVAGLDSKAPVPEISSLERRFSLAAREEMSITVWPETGLTSWLAEMQGGDVARRKWRIIQGFRLKQGGQMDAGPLSQTTETDLVVRQAFPRAAEPPAAIVEWISTAPDNELPYAVGAARHQIYRDETDTKPLEPADRTAYSAALAARYTRGDAALRTFLLTFLPTGRFAKGLVEFDAAIANLEEPDPRVMLVKVVTRATGADSPIIKAGLASTDATVRSVAEAMALRLTENPRVYSRCPSSGRMQVGP
jgi:hypothetical protein